MGSMLEIRKMGEPEDFLGIHICRNRGAGTITVDQEDTVVALAAELGVSGKCRVEPMSPEVFRGVAGGTTRGANGRQAAVPACGRQSDASGRVHSAGYFIACCCPGGVRALPGHPPTSILIDAKYPTLCCVVGHGAIRRIDCEPWNYVRKRKRQPIEFWCDANLSACRDTRRSTTGWVVTMYGGAVSWLSKKQATTTASTIDAEYQACGAAAWEGMSL
jgi:hypothetical protein